MVKTLNESLRQNDLEYLVSPYVSVDQYTSKIKSDNITIAFFCNQLEVAKDLVDFLEKLYPIEISDIEIAETLTEDNKNIVYVELERNQLFPKVLIDIIDSINFLINCDVDDWDFITFGMKDKQKLSYEAIEKNVRLVPLEIKDMAVKAEKPEEESKEKPVKESVEDEFIDEEEYEHGYTEAQSWFHDGNRFDHYDNDEVSDDFWEGFCDGWNDAENDINKFEEEEPDDTGNEYKESVQYSKDCITRTYLDEGIISREELNKIISESESINENSLDAEVLEYNFPESEILTTDKNAFIITGNEIKKLGV